MSKFQPDYNNIIKAAKNQKPDRIPLYEHGFSFEFASRVLNKDILQYWTGKENDIREFLKNFTEFYLTLGYDTISWDHNICTYMPDSGALLGIREGIIKERSDFEKYPWESIEVKFFEDTTKYFKILREVMPDGMKAIGGPGNGIYECVVDLVGYEELCYMSVDDPQLYEDMFKKVGEINFRIWKRFLEEFGDIYAVCKFGDDLGFRSSTLIPTEHIKKHVVPQYKRIVDLIHSHNKPFLYHSCGKIFDVMDEIITVAGIDAKHSNEDEIAHFSVWIDRYGDRIGNFGGIDMDVLCRSSEDEIRRQTKNIIEYVIQHKGGKGFALGSGNSIPDYIPLSGYMAMNETARALRGE